MKKYIALFTAVVLLIAADTLVANTDAYLHSSFAGKIDVTGVGQSLKKNNGSIKASSSSSLSIPSDVTVKAAYLYWAGCWDSTNASAPIDESVTMAHDNGSSLSITEADIVFTDDFGRLSTPSVDSDEDYFGCFKDVTAFFDAHKSGDYTLSGFDGWDGDPHDSEGTVFGGWAVYVIFEYNNPTTEPLRVINVYNGFELFHNSNGGSDAVEFTLSNFILTDSGYNGKIGVLSWEGDDTNTSINENIYVDGQPITSGPNELNNPFNSTLSYVDFNTSNSSSAGDDRSALGMDFDFFDITPYLSGGATSLTSRVQTGWDMVLFNAEIISVTNAPVTDLSVSINGNLTLAAGQTATYAITAANNGPGDPDTVTVTTTVPDGLSYVPGSSTDSADWVVDSSSLPTIAWTYTGDLAGSTGTTLPALNFDATVLNSALSTGLDVECTAIVSSTTFDNVQANNSDSFTSGTIALSAVKTSSAGGIAKPGDEIDYTVTITNTGSAINTSVVADDVFPADLNCFEKPIRITEYYIAPDDFTETSYNLTLDQDLSPDYFVLVQGSDGAADSLTQTNPNAFYAALTGDPFGTGDLSSSGSPNLITLTRGAVFNSWVGVVTVVESLSDKSVDGFRLLTVASLAHSGLSDNISVSVPEWTTNENVVLIGGFNGAGVTTDDAVRDNTAACHARIWSSAPGTINWTRGSGMVSPPDARSTVMAILWGSSWNVQSVNAVGSAGVDGADTSGAYSSTPINPVERSKTWVWGSGHTNEKGIGNSGEGVLITLGDGVNQNATESTIAVGLEYDTSFDFQVYALTHDELAVDYVFKADGDENELTVAVSVAAAQSSRMAIVTNGMNGTGDWFPRPLFSARYIDSTTIQLERRRYGQNFPAWIQGIDFSGIKNILTDCNLALISAGENQSLASGQSIDINYSAVINNNASQGESVTNNVSVMSSELITPVTASAIDYLPFFDSYHTDNHLEKDELFKRDISGGGIHEYVFTGGTGFGSASAFNIAYYDAVGSRVHTETTTASGGELKSYYDNSNDRVHDNSADVSYGEWTTVVMPGAVTPKDTLTEQMTALPTGVSDTFYVSYSGKVLFTDETGASVNGYEMTDGAATAWLTVNDPDAKGAGTITVTVYDNTTGDSETVTLTETGSDSGIFTNSGGSGLSLSFTGGTSANDGTLNVAGDGTIRVDYVDGSGDVYSDEVFIPLMVLISSFYAEAEGDHVNVVWTTASEIDTVGFYLEKLNSDGAFERLNKALLPGLLVSIQGGTYTYTDYSVAPGEEAVYRLIEIERSGSRRTYGPFAVNALAGSVKTASRIAGKSSRNKNTFSRIGKAASQKVFKRSPKKISTKKVTRMKNRLIDKIISFLRFNLLLPVGFSSEPEIKITINETGIYQVEASEIAAQLDISEENVNSLIRYRRLDLRTMGKQVAWYPLEQNSGILFYGKAADSVYTEENVYLLSENRGKKMRLAISMPPRSVSDEKTYAYTNHYEDNKYALVGFATDPHEDYWAGDYLVASNAEAGTRNYVVSLNHVATAEPDAQIALSLQGASSTGIDSEHRVIVKVNNTIVGNMSFSGYGKVSETFSFDQSILSNADNNISITAELGENVPYSIMYINAFDVSYQKDYFAEDNELVVPGERQETISVRGFDIDDILVFDITSTDTPKILTNSKIENDGNGYRVSFETRAGRNYQILAATAFRTPYYVQPVQPSLLKSKYNAYDYIIIVPEEMKAAAESLADYRKTTGHKVIVVTPDTIMDTFNDGVFSPEAIKVFLKYAYDNWAVKPEYLLLVGDGTYDYKNFTGNADSALPPVMVKTKKGLFPSDSWFTDVEGDDGVPDIAAGRLPVVTSDELTAIIDRIKAYESGIASDWQKKLLFVNDDNDSGGDFATLTSNLAVIPGRAYTKTVLSLEQQNSEDVREGILNNLNDGVLFMNYLGHGGMMELTGDGVLNSGDIELLTNADRLPMIATMTCFTGNFSLPGYDSFAESMLTAEKGGAVAVLAPSGITENPYVYYLNQALIKNLLSEEASDKRLGDVLLKTYKDYAKRTNEKEVLRVLTLFGDPATRIAR